LTNMSDDYTCSAASKALRIIETCRTVSEEEPDILSTYGSKLAVQLGLDPCNAHVDFPRFRRTVPRVYWAPASVPFDDQLAYTDYTHK
jgi:hypothetical protein